MGAFSRSSEPDRFLKWIVAAGAALVAALYVPLLFAPAAGAYHDDGLYLVTARALAEGRGYRILSLPAEPLQTKYPILFPWLLSLPWRLGAFPANLPLLRLVPLTASFVWLFLTWRLIRRYGASANQSVFVIIMTVVSPWIAFVSTVTLSETTFAAIVTAGLLMLEGGSTTSKPWRAFASGALMGASLLTRAAGVATAGAGLLTLCARRRWRDSVVYAGGALLVAGPWFYWVASHGASAAAVDVYNSGEPYKSWNIVMSYTAIEKARVLALNARYVLWALPRLWGLGWLPVMLADVLAATFVVLVARGMWQSRLSASVLVFLAYVAMVLAWVWYPVRFLVPLIPLLLWFAIRGAGRSHLARVLAAAVCIVSVVNLVGVTAQARRSGVTWPGDEVPDDWRSMLVVFDWIRENAPADAVLSGNLDPTYYLYTGRKAVRAFDTDPFLLDYSAERGRRSPIGTRDDFARRLVTAHVDYLIITPSRQFNQMLWVQEFVRDLVQSHPDGLVPVNGEFDPGYTVYRVNRARLPGA